MIFLGEIRDWLKTVEPRADNYYIGRLDGKKPKSIGVYQLKSGRQPVTAIGGPSSYDTKDVSILLHWTENANETERAAYELFTAIRNAENIVIGSTTVWYVQPLVAEPVNVGTDGTVYESVIELRLYFEKKEG